jgi:hypothetical protein
MNTLGLCYALPFNLIIRMDFTERISLVRVTEATRKIQSLLPSPANPI